MSLRTRGSASGSPLRTGATHTRDGSPRAVLRQLRQRVRGFEVVSLGLAVLLALLVAYPLARVLVATFVVDGHVDLTPVLQAFEHQGVGRLVLTTASITLPAGFLALILGLAFAWLNERTDATLGALGNVLPMLPFFLPAIAGAIGWVFLLDPNAGFANALIRKILNSVGLHLTTGPINIYSWGGLVFVYMLYLVPFAYLMLATGLRNVDPRLEEQARVCGSSNLRTLLRITLPAIKPSLAAAALLMIVFGFGLFSVPLIIGTEARIDVLSVHIVNLMTASYPPNIGAATGLSLVMIVITGSVWYAQTRIVKGGRFATIGGRGQATSIHRLGKWKWFARASVLTYVAIAAVFPIVALVIVALSGYWTTHISWGSLSLRAFQQTLDDPTTHQALINSLKLGIAGAIIGTLAMGVASVALQKSRSRGATVLRGVLKLPAAISPIIFAIGFILAFGGPPFKLGGTLVILLLGFLVVFMPWASVAADAAAAQVGAEVVEASRSSGAGGLRTFMRINLPLMLPGLMAGAALLFVLIMGDIDVSIMLAGYSNETVGFQILSIFTNTSWSELAALATILTAISTLVVGSSLGLAARLARWRR